MLSTKTVSPALPEWALAYADQLGDGWTLKDDALHRHLDGYSAIITEHGAVWFLSISAKLPDKDVFRHNHVVGLPEFVIEYERKTKDLIANLPAEVLGEVAA